MHFRNLTSKQRNQYHYILDQLYQAEREDLVIQLNDIMCSDSSNNYNPDYYEYMDSVRRNWPTTKRLIIANRDPNWTYLPEKGEWCNTNTGELKNWDDLDQSNAKLLGRLLFYAGGIPHD